MNALQKLFAPAKNKVEVVFLRSCFVNGQRYEEGSTHRFSAKEAADLIVSGAAYDPLADNAQVKKVESLESQLPPPVTPAPVPESFQHLPESFSKWWTLNAAREALQSRADAIEEKIMAWYVNKSPNFSVSLQGLPAEQSRRIFSTMNFEISKDLPGEYERMRFLKDAYLRANQAISHWKDANLPELIKCQLEASTHTQLVHGALCKSIRELHAKALELFQIRIAALGLSQFKVEDLFRGSADCERFASIQPPRLQDLKLAWHEHGQDPVHYIAHNPPTLAGMIAGYDRTAAEVEALTKQAEKELSTAKRITSKAA